MKSIHFQPPVADDMVRAILENRKTVTRRVLKPQTEERRVPGETGCYIYRGIPCGLNGMTNLAPYHPGDILYVRETWAAWSPTYGTAPEIIYKADGYSKSHKMKWRPSIHMPREAARIFLRVTDVMVERLQEIDDDGVVAEGVEIGAPFDELWDTTIKPKDRALCGWEANPWVWVIEFERCEKPKGDRYGTQGLQRDLLPVRHTRAAAAGEKRAGTGQVLHLRKPDVPPEGQSSGMAALRDVAAETGVICDGQ